MAEKLVLLRKVDMVKFGLKEDLPARTVVYEYNGLTSGRAKKMMSQ